MSVYDYSVTFPDGSTKPLSDWAGQPLLLINVASKCGFTPQYEGLEALQRGGDVQLIGFPCNQFGDQEPGSDAEIADFCKATYDVTFPMSTKIDVNGPSTDPLWAYLRAQAPGDFGPSAGMLYEILKERKPETIGTDEVKWNFTKFLVDGDGKVVRRYESYETPQQIGSDLAAHAG
ncbi:MAG TPA: glutathione peroxidase [Mycobacteriales bacterium]|nr:glutathione peroxidase [Mycobacteriales bacterium]